MEILQVHGNLNNLILGILLLWRALLVHPVFGCHDEPLQINEKISENRQEQ